MSNNYISTVTVIGLPKEADFSAWLREFASHCDLIYCPGEYAENKLRNIEWDFQEAAIPALSNGDKLKFLAFKSDAVAWGAIQIRDPWTFEDVSWPRFEIERKWRSLGEELLGYSKMKTARDLVFHLEWHDIDFNNENGVATFKNGKVLDQWTANNESAWNFNKITQPPPDFLVEHAGLTLAQLAKYRLQQAGDVFAEVSRILHSDQFNERNCGTENPPQYVPRRNAEKTVTVTKDVQALAEHIQAAVQHVDFSNVILPTIDHRLENLKVTGQATTIQ